MANVSSRIYKTLEQDELERVVIHALGPNAAILETSLLKGGLFNTTYYVATDTPARKLVIRVAPIRGELLFDFERVMMGIEPLMYRLMGEAGVPVPEVVLHDNTRAIIDREYIITEFIDDCIPYNDPAFPEEAKDRIQYNLGLYTARIHSIHAKKFGWPLPDGSVNGADNWADVLATFCQEIVSRCKEHDVIAEPDLLAFERFLRDHRQLFSNVGPPSLVHNDLWAPNVLVRFIEGEWQIAVIIDADRAIYADREFEFVLWRNEPSFMEGYGQPLDMSQEGEQKRLFYNIALDLFCAYVYKVQYDNVEGYESCKGYALDNLRRLIGE